MAKQPQDYKKPSKKTKKVEPHDPSEHFTYEAPHSGVTVSLPYTENIPTGAIRKAARLAGEDQMAFYFALMEDLLGDEFEDLIDPLLNRELAEMVERWESESATQMGESSAS